MQITAPAPIIYLPENLWSLFTRPGRELLIRVLNIEGKTLYLELGGEKFQARIGGTLSPENFTIGEVLKVRVAKTGNPIILQVVSPEKEAEELKFLYLVNAKLAEKPINKEIFQKDFNLLATFIKDLVGATKKERKETIDKELKDLFGDKIKSLNIFYKDEKIVIPFVFSDERSWGFLELGEPKEEKDRIKLFYFKMFFEYLGLMECFLGYTGKEIFVELYFANKESFEFAKEEIKNLESLFTGYKISTKISVNIKEILPGQLLKKEG
ncbi:MAG: hypothetical protein C0190_06845 [Thermodesulfobacterium geofontis]|uniref:Uncharacterized protein n=1 Tax=Thermodesulfobacterium geofontis TaxID=1295609 RepID=A0A2N7PLY5_9BACT|nr:MAG: hypothetical protein C0190_06845 [Thermodesulfobacterium geofontis]